MRGIAQTVSYEVMFALALLFFLFLSFSLNLVLISKINSLWLKALVFIPVAAIIFISSVYIAHRELKLGNRLSKEVKAARRTP